MPTIALAVRATIIDARTRLSCGTRSRPRYDWSMRAGGEVTGRQSYP